MEKIALPLVVAIPTWTFPMLEPQIREAVLSVTNEYTDESNIKVQLDLGDDHDEDNPEVTTFYTIITVSFLDDSYINEKGVKEIQEIQLILDSTTQYQIDMNTKITYEFFNCGEHYQGYGTKRNYDDLLHLILWAINNHNYVLNDETIRYTFNNTIY